MAKAGTTGDKDVAAALKRAAKHPTGAERKRIRRKVLQGLVKSARANLMANGSKKTGRLSAALGIVDDGKDVTTAGPVRGRLHSSVAHLVEFGTAAHFQPKRFGGIMHPGARPKPFLRPAFEEHKEQIVRDLGDEVFQAIQVAFGKAFRR